MENQTEHPEYKRSKKTGKYLISEIFTYAQSMGGYVEYICQICFQEVSVEERKNHRDTVHP